MQVITQQHTYPVCSQGKYVLKISMMTICVKSHFLIGNQK